MLNSSIEFTCQWIHSAYKAWFLRESCLSRTGNLKNYTSKDIETQIELSPESHRKQLNFD